MSRLIQIFRGTHSPHNREQEHKCVREGQQHKTNKFILADDELLSKRRKVLKPACQSSCIATTTIQDSSQPFTPPKRSPFRRSHPAHSTRPSAAQTEDSCLVALAIYAVVEKSFTIVILSSYLCVVPPSCTLLCKLTLTATFSPKSYPTWPRL